MDYKLHKSIVVQLPTLRIFSQPQRLEKRDSNFFGTDVSAEDDAEKKFVRDRRCVRLLTHSHVELKCWKLISINITKRLRQPQTSGAMS